MSKQPRTWKIYLMSALIAGVVGGLAGRHVPPVPEAGADILYRAADVDEAIQEPARAVTEGLKLGFLNTQYIFNNHPQVPEIQQAFENQLMEWQRQQAELEERAQTLQTELRTAQLGLQERRRKEQELTQVMQDLQTFQVEMWGQGGRAEQKEQELMKPVVDAMDAVIADLAGQEDYDLIFDAASSGMLFGHKDLDLTSTVMERLGISPPEGGPGS